MNAIRAFVHRGGIADIVHALSGRARSCSLIGAVICVRRVAWTHAART